MSGNGITIDPEFQSLIPPLSAEEKAQLEQNIVLEGCRDALVVWGENNVLLDGHNRYEICERLGLPYDYVRANAGSRDDAKAWMIRNQFGRRNLTPFVRAELALALEPLISPGQGARTELRQNSDKVDTKREVAKAAGLSHDTIARTKVIREKADDDTKAALRKGETTINKVYTDLKREEKRAAKVEELAAEPAEPIDSGKIAPVPLILCDPPWRYEFSQSGSREIENQYPTMSQGELEALPVHEIMMPDCVIYMWATAPKLLEALDLLAEWGFEYKTCAVWDKQKIGMGYYFRQQTELILVGKRGNPPAPAPESRVSSLLSYPRGKHSAKPVEFYEALEAMYPEFCGRRVELFARQPRDGWLSWGNEA